MLSRISSVSRNENEIHLLNLDCGAVWFPNFSLKHLWGSIAILFLLRKEKGKMHIVNLYGIQILHAPLNYRSREILNQFAARKCSAIKDEKRYGITSTNVHI